MITEHLGCRMFRLAIDRVGKRGGRGLPALLCAIELPAPVECFDGQVLFLDKRARAIRRPRRTLSSG